LKEKLASDATMKNYIEETIITHRDVHNSGKNSRQGSKGRSHKGFSFDE